MVVALKQKLIGLLTRLNSKRWSGRDSIKVLIQLNKYFTYDLNRANMVPLSWAIRDCANAGVVSKESAVGNRRISLRNAAVNSKP